MEVCKAALCFLALNSIMSIFAPIHDSLEVAGSGMKIMPRSNGSNSQHLSIADRTASTLVANEEKKQKQNYNPNFRLVPSLQAQALLYVVQSNDSSIKEEVDAIQCYAVPNNAPRIKKEEIKKQIRFLKEALKAIRKRGCLGDPISEPIVCTNNQLIIQALCALLKDKQQSYLISDLLLASAFSDALETLKFLEDYGADLNKDNLLTNAAFHANMRVLSYLLGSESKYVVTREGLREAIALCNRVASTNMNKDSAMALLNAAQSALDREFASKDKEFLIAASNGNTADLKSLLEQGANINALDEQKTSALMIAAQAGYKEAVEFLLSKNISKRLKNNSRFTAKQLAKQAGNHEIAKLLREEMGYNYPPCWAFRTDLRWTIPT